MQTYTGRQFFPLDPRDEDIDELDIAHALSLICRYGGHVDTFYSVAEHSVLVSEAVPEEFALVGLLHDAAEAYVGDMVRPLKATMTTYRAAEDRLLGMIMEKYGLPFNFGYDLPRKVKEVDNRILLDERDYLMKAPPERWHQDTDGSKRLGVTIDCLDPQDAEERFRYRLKELTDGK
jgi:5'-deoxynucleotidase YfbR-like HD superfamily hydrolase